MEYIGRQKNSHRCGLILLGVLGGVLLAELTLTVLGLPRFEQKRDNLLTGGLQFYTDERAECLLYTIKPNTEYINIYGSNPRGYFDEQNSVCISANRQGFRGEDFVKAAQTNVVRIAFLGDSFTLGEGVRFEDTYSEKAASKLNHDLQSEGSAFRVQSYNFSMLGYNTLQQWAILTREVLQYDPDIVVVGYFINDAAGPYYRFDVQSSKIVSDHSSPFWVGLGESPPSTFPYRFRVAQYLWKAQITRNAARATVSYYNSLYQESNPYFAQNRDALESIIDVCENKGIELIVMCFPVLHRLGRNYPFKAIHDKVSDIVEERGKSHTQFIDCMNVFSRVGERYLWVHPSDHHPNERAHEIIADVLAGRIMDAIASR